MPIFSLVKTFSLRGAILDDALFRFLSTEIDGDNFRAAVDAVMRATKLGAESYEALSASMQHLLGRSLSLTLAKETSWRIAGNIPRLKDRLPITPWVRQTVREWAPIQIMSSRYRIRRVMGKKGGVPGRMFRVRFLAGSPCPGETTHFWPTKAVNFIAQRLGFSWPSKPLGKRHDLEMTNLRAVVLLEPQLSQGSPQFKYIACVPTLVSFNRGLIKQRRRIGFTCPFLYQHECFQCPHGLENCEAATHPQEYEIKMCARCGKEAWFDTDPNWLNDFCCSCQPLVDSGI